MIYILFGIILLIILGYIFVKQKYAYWADRNVPFIPGKFPFGSEQNPSDKRHMAIVIQNFYMQFKGRFPFLGIFFGLDPTIVALDLDFVKNVMTRDFQYFTNRGIYHNEKDDPLSAHLFSVDNEQWKKLRVKMTPTFTSGKMKNMFSMIVAVANEFTNCLTSAIESGNGDQIEMKELFGRFTTDVIGTCAFGIQCNSLHDPNAKFREMGRKIFTHPRHGDAGVMFYQTFKGFSKMLGIKTTPEGIEQFFMGAIKDTVASRETNNIRRNDFIDLMIDLKNGTDGSESLTIEEIAAQAFVFFVAGYETSSAALTYALHELSKNQNIQEKARDETRSVFASHNNQFTFESLKEMKYIEQIIKESLRKYPPLPTLMRNVSKTYKESKTGVVFEKNRLVIIPAYAIHHDPEYYPNPQVFNPDRFTNDEINKRHPYAFIPFGEGPRNCIGLRFGMMQTKICLAMLLNNFKFTPCTKSVDEMTFLKSFVLATSDGLFLNVEKV